MISGSRRTLGFLDPRLQVSGCSASLDWGNYLMDFNPDWLQRSLPSLFSATLAAVVINIFSFLRTFALALSLISIHKSHPGFETVDIDATQASSDDHYTVLPSDWYGHLCMLYDYTFPHILHGLPTRNKNKKYPSLSFTERRCEQPTASAPNRPPTPRKPLVQACGASCFALQLAPTPPSFMRPIFPLALLRQSRCF